MLEQEEISNFIYENKKMRKILEQIANYDLIKEHGNLNNNAIISAYYEIKEIANKTLTQIK